MRTLAELRLSGAPEGARIEVLDPIGRRVDSITLRAGRAVWQADDALPPGIYFVRAALGGAAFRGRIVLLR
jgi:hypothetical protein